MHKLDGPWSKQTILEPKTGQAYNKYFYKRKPAFRVKVNSDKAIALAGYGLIEKDLLSDNQKFIESMDHVKATEDRDRFNLVKAPFVAALTFYGKYYA